MIVLFPFEVGFYKSYDYDVDFLGHPLLDELSPKFKDPEYFRRSRERYGIKAEEKLIALMPGSRKSEIEHHLQVQLDVAETLYKEDNSLNFNLLVAPGMDKEEMRAKLPRLNFPLTIVKDEPFDMIHMSDAVLAASGTATLFVGLLKKPMVVMYIMKPLTVFLAKMIVKSIPFFGIVNIIMNKEVSRELLQQDASVENLVKEMKKIIYDEKAIQAQVDDLAKLPAELGNSGVTERVATYIEGLLT